MARACGVCHHALNIDDPSLQLNATHRLALHEKKAYLYESITRLQAQSVQAGTQEPLVEVVVSGVNSLYKVLKNFNVPERNVRELATMVEVPLGFCLAEMALANTPVDEASYILAVEIVHQVIGSTISFDTVLWAMYIEEASEANHYQFHFEESQQFWMSVICPKEKLRLLTFQWMAETLSVDMQHVDVALNVNVPQPQETSGRSIFHEEGALAHDRVYFGKGVYDRQFYHGALLKVAVVVLDPTQVTTIWHDVPWVSLVDTDPFQVLLLDNITFIDQPWYNNEEI
jgi:hypothetical protein